MNPKSNSSNTKTSALQTSAAVASAAAATAQAIGETAFDQLLPTYQAIPLEQLLVINVDIPTAVTTVLGALRTLRGMSAEIQKVVPEVDLAAINLLETYAYALSWAHGRVLSEGEGTNALLALVTEGTALRDTLMSDVNALAKRGLIDGSRLQETQGPVGYRNLSTDLTILSNILRDNWETIQGKSAVEFEEIDRALRLSEAILLAVGERNQDDVALESPGAQRVRAYTLLATAYDRVRQAVHFLRWSKGDGNHFAPSLQSNRSRKTDDHGDVTPPATDNQPAAPVAVAAPATTPVTTPGVPPMPGTAPHAASSHSPDADPFLK